MPHITRSSAPSLIDLSNALTPKSRVTTAVKHRKYFNPIFQHSIVKEVRKPSELRPVNVFDNNDVHARHCLNAFDNICERVPEVVA